MSYWTLQVHNHTEIGWSADLIGSVEQLISSPSCIMLSLLSLPVWLNTWAESLPFRPVWSKPLFERRQVWHWCRRELRVFLSWTIYGEKVSDRCEGCSTYRIKNTLFWHISKNGQRFWLCLQRPSSGLWWRGGVLQSMPTLICLLDLTPVLLAVSNHKSPSAPVLHQRRNGPFRMKSSVYIFIHIHTNKSVK